MLLESKTVKDAIIIDMMATYFVFDIAYPKAISAVMLFFSSTLRLKLEINRPFLDLL